jgi:ribonuclease Z
MRRFLVLAALAASLAGCDRLIERQLERNLTRVDASVLRSPDLQVVICGSGSPLPDPTRAAACTAVIAGGEFCSSTRARLVEVLTRELAAHLSAVAHAPLDHIGGLGEAITQSWIAGRKQPLEVYGPEGVARVVAGFGVAYERDVDYRVAHHGDDWMPRAASGAEAHEVALGDALDAFAVVLERNGLVTHVQGRYDPCGRRSTIASTSRAARSWSPAIP